MKKRTHRLQRILCAAAAALLVPGTCQVSHAEVIRRYYYKGIGYEKSEEGGGKIDVKYYKGKRKEVTVPKKIRGKTVQGIYVNGKARNMKILHIPNDVEVNYLTNAVDLEKITVKRSNRKYAVKNNLLLSRNKKTLLSVPGGIKKVRIPDCVRKIGDQAFYEFKLHKESRHFECEEVILGKNVVSIGMGAFSMSGLNRIWLNEGLRTIGYGAFAFCYNLESITIPSTVKSLSGFEDTVNLKKIYIKSKKCRIAYNAIPENTIIYGKKGSTAEAYAKKYGNQFVAF